MLVQCLRSLITHARQDHHTHKANLTKSCYYTYFVELFIEAAKCHSENLISGSGWINAHVRMHAHTHARTNTHKYVHDEYVNGKSHVFIYQSVRANALKGRTLCACPCMRNIKKKNPSKRLQYV